MIYKEEGFTHRQRVYSTVSWFCCFGTHGGQRVNVWSQDPPPLKRQEEKRGEGADIRGHWKGSHFLPVTWPPSSYHLPRVP